MGRSSRWWMVGILAAAVRCSSGSEEPSTESSWSALMDDGDLSAIAASGNAGAPASGPPSRSCSDCTRQPLAFWKLDDCNTQSTELADSATTSSILHPAFRAVSAACAAGADGQAIRLSGTDDVVYAPDQPDFLFNQGLTIAAWIKPDSIAGTQSLVRKRFDGTSSFTLAIDGRKLTFVVRLTNGRLVGVSAPIQANQFTHVAAIYDGQQALLYLNGALAAKAKGAGTIAPGAGPILIGNDADGREMKGIVDDVWLNTLPAPADAVTGLTCIRQQPMVSLSPGQTSPEIAGTIVPFDLAVTNPSSASCPVDWFQYSSKLSLLLTSDSDVGVLSVAPGQIGHATINVKSSRMVSVGSYPFQVTAFAQAASQFSGSASANYVVGTGRVACDGSPPQTPLITGTLVSPVGGSYVYAAPGLTAPTVTLVSGSDGSTQAVQVTASPGVPTDPSNSYLGLGLAFSTPACLDASAYIGVKFTIAGALGTCALTFATPFSEDSAVPFGVCTASAGCYPPFSPPLSVGSHVIPFSGMSGGSPLAVVDPTALMGVQWQFNVPTDGVTAPCVANFTISDVAFVSDPNALAVNYRFDAGTQGWRLDNYNNPTSTNLGAVVPDGGMAPALGWTGSDGDPNAGALSTSVTFTDFNQYVDADINIPPLDLSGKTLHTRVRLASGSFLTGGLQFHASTGPSYVWAAAPFVGAGSLPLGQWVPVDLDLDAVTVSGFDPHQVLQIGVQFLTGSSTGQFFPNMGATIFEIDTVTDGQ